MNLVSTEGVGFEKYSKEIPAPPAEGEGLIVVVVILAVALLQGRGRGAGGGAGGFDPGLGEQRRRHGDLDQLVALNQPDERFEALERRLRVPLLPQQVVPQVHAALHTQETAAITSC